MAGACKLPVAGNAESRLVVVEAPSITLAWDAPQAPLRLGPVEYRVYYAKHGTHSWNLLAEVGATESPKYTVNYSDLGSGHWMFAVSAVMDNRGVSRLHSSIDLTADPLGGWYVKWIGDLR